ncbi:MAG: STAS domain-containing protein [Phycisphaerae bacterium]
MSAQSPQSPKSPVESIEWQQGTAVVQVVGDIDLNRSPALQDALLKLLDENPSTVVIDLGGVGYMDSSGVASLVKLLSRVRKKGVSLKLAGLTDRVRNIFEITRLDSVFEIHGTREEALG